MSETQEPVVLTPEQKEALIEWVEAAQNVPGWLGGYPLGGAYVDARAAAGSRKDGRQAFVKLSREVAKMVPQLRGKYLKELVAALGDDAEIRPILTAGQVRAILAAGIGGDDLRRRLENAAYHAEVRL